MLRRITQIRKRDGKVMPFGEAKIADAIFKAAEAVGGEDRFVADELASAVATAPSQGRRPTTGVRGRCRVG